MPAIFFQMKHPKNVFGRWRIPVKFTGKSDVILAGPKFSFALRNTRKLFRELYGTVFVPKKFSGLLRNARLVTVRCDFCIPTVNSCKRKKNNNKNTTTRVSNFSHLILTRSSLPNEEQALVTNPVAGKIYLCALSDNYTSITICRTIESTELSHPIDSLYFADNVIVVTDCFSTEKPSGEVKVVIIENSGVKEAFKFGAAHGVALPFGFCEINGEVYFSDHLKHCICKIIFFGAVGGFDSRAHQTF